MTDFVNIMCSQLVENISVYVIINIEIKCNYNIKILVEHKISLLYLKISGLHISLLLFINIV